MGERRQKSEAIQNRTEFTDISNVICILLKFSQLLRAYNRHFVWFCCAFFAK